MKILAIRGKNLASLSGDFAVELARPPLSSAGIFAISGPTGSGKTTLLDAMCLALFDRTPRLNDRGGVKVGQPGYDEALWVASQDVRSLLRKGCSMGAAEVDFTGRDGRVYRARWTVRRARDRVDGQLQPQTMTLQVLETGELIGRTKSEVLAEITARLGLSFEQFRRSALLAQGDFAAFLRAGERERAELLEQMTGTGLYGQVSVLAYERARSEQRSLEELQGKQGDVRVLGEAERGAMVAALAAAEGAAEAARVRLQRAEEARAWARQREAMAAQLAEAEGELGEAREAQQKAEGARREQARLDELLPLLPLLERLDLATAAAQKAEAEAQRREREAGEADEAEAEAQRGRVEASREREAAQAAQAEAAPGLARASQLDADIAGGRRRLGEIDLEVREATFACERGQREVDELSGALAAASRARDAAVEALRGLGQWAALARDWEGRWRKALGRFYTSERELGSLDRSAAASRLADAREQAARAEEALASAEQRWAQASELAREADERASSFDPEGLRRRREGLASFLAVLSQMARAAEEGQQAASQRKAAAEAAEVAEQSRELEQHKARSSSAERSRLEGALDEAQKALGAAQAALSLAGHRASLVEGEACPLCGATEHPWASAAPALDSLVASQQKRVRHLLESRQAADRDVTASMARVQSYKERAQEERRRAQAQAESMEEISMRWSRYRAQVAEVAPRGGLPGEIAGGLSESAFDGGAAGSVTFVEQSVEASMQACRAEEQQLEEARKAAARARKALDAAQASRDRAREAREQGRRGAEQAALALARSDEQVERLRREQATLLDELGPVFDGHEGWRDALVSDVEAFGKRCAGQALAYQRHEAELARAEGEIAALTPRREAAAARLAEREAARAARSRARGEQADALGALEAARSSLLSGRPVDEVSGELQRLVAGAEARERAAQASHEARELRAAEARGVAAATRDLAGRRAADEAEARARLEQAAPGDARAQAAELRALLAPGAAEIERRRQALLDVDQRAGRAALIAAERRGQIEAHDRGRAAGWPADPEAEAELASRALVEAEDQHSTAKVRLGDDDQQQRRLERLGAELEGQRKRAELWGSLASLIGSADGKKFRVFAQSLTFDSLLSLANLHLDELARRYQLMRVPGTDLDLQIIDREMADEVRPSTSLSGGESFLVSLSLALGLSSLGSRDTRVETLFIDEGFGTLDAESLEVALSALDALQGTGRQVGLISHIPGLVERLGACVRVQPHGAGRSAVVAEGTEQRRLGVG